MIDHIAGSRRGQRQELAPAPKLAFGRHPDNQVTFDAHRDLDASSRHAELRCEEDRFMLVDVGSSNGTFVDGARVIEVELPVARPIDVEFGEGGPRLRLFIGDDAQVAELPGIETSAGAAPVGGGRRALLILVVLAVLGAATALGWWHWGR